MIIKRKKPLKRRTRLRPGRPSRKDDAGRPPVPGVDRETGGGSFNGALPHASVDEMYNPMGPLWPSRAGRSWRYLAFIREKPCCVCKKPGPSDAHHIAPRGQKGMGMKVSDYHTVPLCRKHHDDWHRNGFVEIGSTFSPTMGRYWQRSDFLIEQASLLVEWLEGSAYEA